jgi:protein lifeguard
LNLILLGIFTIAESILLGAISASYKVDTVLIAVGITAVVVVGLTIFSFQTKIDFTGLGTYLFVAFLVLFAFSILALIIRSKILNIVYAALGAGLFSMYLVFDTQLMMGKFIYIPSHFAATIRTIFI